MRTQPCPECDGRGWFTLWQYGNELGGDICERCLGAGLVPAFPLVHRPYDGSVLFTRAHVVRVYGDAMCFADGWFAAMQSLTPQPGGPYRMRVNPDYADVRDFLLDGCDPMIAMQVALHVTRPNDCYWLHLPVLF